MSKAERDQANSAETVSHRLTSVIVAIAERIHYAEGRRANYSVMAGVFIAAGITILTFAVGTIDIQWMRFSAIGASFGMILVGAVVIFVFSKQTNRYPFTEPTKTWKWFYRDALPDYSDFDLKWWHFWSDQDPKVQEAYRNQLPKFRERIRGLVDERRNLDQDIEQAYVLHINELYKNIYLSKLSSLFDIGLILIAILTLIGGFYGAYLDTGFRKSFSLSSSNSVWAHRTEYRLVSEPTSKSAEWLVRAAVTNNLNQTLSVQKLLLRDGNDWPLPVEITYVTSLPRSILPHRTEVLFATMKGNREVWKSISSMDLEVQ